ncbi:MAG TPA: LysR substrate-binding domain-containing protein [Cytophagales bacterium]|nr:LysR substrate-binding domain-containing protein [Cytophagales bacterium]
MNIQQLEYVVAVDELRHFVKAADKCCVTQPTLSMMLQKLEEELNLKIFDRTKHPIEPTAAGIEVISRARKILGEVAQLKEFSRDLYEEVSGTIKIGVIPTLAPYLLPLFIEELISEYPGLKVIIKEMPTQALIESLKNNQCDLGILATPLNESGLKEYPLFYEDFLAYSSSIKNFTSKNFVIPSQIDISQLWLLEEGHCFRNQVLNFCELKHKDLYKNRLEYEAGSIETLINLVDKNKGITIVPYLATLNFSAEQKKKLRRFSNPQPVREVSLVVNNNFARFKILEAIKTEILAHTPTTPYEKGKTVVQL